MKKCGYCNGTGRKVEKERDTGSGYKFRGFALFRNQTVNERCPKCQGTGIKNK